MAVDSRAVERIVGTLEVAVLVVGFGGSVQRIQVQATDEADILSQQTPAVNVADVGLGDGVAALLAREGGI